MPKLHRLSSRQTILNRTHIVFHCLNFILSVRNCLQIPFLSGIHSLTSNIVIRDVIDVTFQFEMNSQIHCDNKSNFVFMNITNLQIIGLKMTNCGVEIDEALIEDALFVQTETVQTIKKGLQAAIFAVNIRQFHMDSAMINGSYGYGLLGINIIGDSFVTHTLINSSNTNSLTDYCQTFKVTPTQASECLGGNAVFLYNDFPECPDTIKLYTLTIINSTFSHGLNPIGIFETYVGRGGGLGIIVTQKYYDVHVKLVNSTFTTNTARSFGSNLSIRFMITETNSSVGIHNCHIKLGRSNSDSAPDAIPYSSLVLLHGLYETSLGNYKNCSNLPRVTYPPDYQKPHRQLLLIEDCKFYGNVGGAIYAVSFTSLLAVVHTYTILIRNCTFSKNVALRASALYVLDISSENTNLLEMTVEDTIIEAHTTFTEVQSGIQSAISFISSVERFTFRNCLFAHNNDSTLLLHDSNVYFEGVNVFKNNSAQYGGAIYLISNSIIYLHPNTWIIFDNNSALERGGAIYITGGTEVAYFFNCAIQVFDPSFMETSKLNVTMMFINNTAIEAGDAIYGGGIDLCFALAPSEFLYLNDTLTGTLIFDTITDFDSQPPSTSLVASDAVKICFCFEGIHDCSVKSWTVSKYPGEEFHVSVIGIGQRDGTVPAVVQTQHNYFQRTESTCTNASYRVSSSASTEQLYLTATTAKVNSPSPLLVTVNLIPCDTLVGFRLDSEKEVCSCELQLKLRNMTCDIDKKIITRQPPFWLGNYSNNLLLHNHCPYDYCLLTQVDIAMVEPNISEQCAFNRYGTLCGSCGEGYSHVFGSSRCIKCSNAYLLLIFPFALAGIALVVFLFALNLTVSVGTINGLIFYANIIKINETIFFPPGDRSFFRTFISWVNLDLGIETCFYDGMDSLGKTWLQFVFPFYLWAIVLAITVMFRYSGRLTELCGDHSVPVLATIFLLSFTKLLQTITKALSFTTLEFPDSHRAVWLYDGTIWYGTNGHLALIIFSSLFLLVIGFPYAILILTVQFLRQCSEKWFLRWVDKLMPIFDAYLGPYKPKQGYWTGLLLLIRVILVAVFALNVFGNPAIDIFVVSVVAIFLISLNLGQGGVYKKTGLTILDISYIVNLGLLTAATALVRQIDGKQGVSVIYTSNAIAVMTFIGTLVYHVKLRIVKWCTQGRNLTARMLRAASYEQLNDIPGDMVSPAEVPITVVDRPT